MANTEEKAVQFIAQLKIERKSVPSTQSLMRPASEQKRELSEVAQITLKAGTLEKLVEKLSKHIAIIEED